MKYSAIQPVDCMQSKQRPCTFILPCKTIDFQHIDKLCTSHILHFAPCILCNKTILCSFHSLQQIEVIFLYPVHHILHSIRLHRYYNCCGAGWAGPGRGARPGRDRRGRGEGRRAGVQGTWGMCTKSCKRFGVKNARGENLWKRVMGSGKRMGGSRKRVHFVGKKRIFVGKGKCIIC